MFLTTTHIPSHAGNLELSTFSLGAVNWSNIRALLDGWQVGNPSDPEINRSIDVRMMSDGIRVGSDIYQGIMHRYPDHSPNRYLFEFVLYKTTGTGSGFKDAFRNDVYSLWGSPSNEFDASPSAVNPLSTDYAAEWIMGTTLVRAIIKTVDNGPVPYFLSIIIIGSAEKPSNFPHWQSKFTFERLLSKVNVLIEADPNNVEALLFRSKVLTSLGSLGDAWDDVVDIQALNQPVDPRFLEELKLISTGQK